MKVDLLFKLVAEGEILPTDHNYGLFAAISRALENHTAQDGQWLHGNPHIGLLPVNGLYIGRGKIALGEKSSLGLRLPPEYIHCGIKLAGKRLRVLDSSIRVGIAHVRPLVPAPVLFCRYVTTKNGDDRARFDAEIRRQLEALGIAAKIAYVPRISKLADNNGKKDPCRRLLTIKGKRIVGYSLLASDLSPADSIKLQEAGLGGRRRMGCGVFVPADDSRSLPENANEGAA